jgi:signal transduction histidine kinase
MKAGAHDFVLKGRLARLVPAVRRELGEAAHRTEQRRMREQILVSQEALLRSEKLRALGQMAAGISHDLKNILNPLSLQIQFLRRAVGRGEVEDAHQTINEMAGVVRRGVETIERLRRFSRKPDAAHGEELVDLNLLAHEAIEIARPRMSSRSGALCMIREELGAPPLIRAGAEEILSSIINLVANAIDAQPDGGTITLRTGERDGGAWVDVADTGPGMSEDVAARVFEPFFTTKGQEGTGLGLAMVHASVERHRGTLKLTTSPGQGATFELWFPGAKDKG